MKVSDFIESRNKEIWDSYKKYRKEKGTAHKVFPFLSEMYGLSIRRCKDIITEMRRKEEWEQIG